MLVDRLDNTVTRPPSPLAVALAAMLAPWAICTVCAVSADAVPGPPAARASVVPIATVPPPAGPAALTRARFVSVTPWLASTCTWPPTLPGAVPSAATTPLSTIEPPSPPSTTVPVCDPTLSETILPPACTRFCTSPSASRAVSWTVPPSARITPVLVTSAVTGLPPGPVGACVTALLTSSASSPSPYRSSVAVFAPASTTWPRYAVITPELATRGATSAARPAC